MGEELRDTLPHFIINAAFTHMCSLQTEGGKSPIFYVQLLISIASQTRESSLFKSFQKLTEEALVYLAHHSASLDIEIRERVRNVTAYYVSQLPDIRGDSIYQKLEEAGVSPSYIESLFQQLIRMSFYKKLKDNTDEKFHTYLPDQEHSQSDLVLTHLAEGKEHPDAKLLTERFNQKETPAYIRELLAD